MAEKRATREALGETLIELAAEGRDDIVVLDADLAKATTTVKFAAAYPDRFFDVGIAEQNLIGTAAGLAAGGKTPFASTFAVFATGRAYDQIRNSVCYGNLNVKIAATHAGVTVGPDGGSHQMLEDVALMRVLPNMTVLVPADYVSAKAAVRAAASHRGPVYIRLGRPAVPVIHDAGAAFEIGVARVLRGGAVVTCEEHSIIGGLGSAVAEALVESAPVPMERVGVRDVFGTSGEPDELMRHFGLTAADVAAAARRVLARKA